MLYFRRHAFYVLAFVCFMLSSLKVTANPIDISTTKTISSFQVMVFEDPTKKLEVEGLEVGAFTKSSSRFTFPLEDANFWFYFTVVNDSDTSIQRIIFHDEPYPEVADFYVQEKAGYVRYKNGLDIRLEDRDIESFLPAIQVELKPYESKKIFVKTFSAKKLLVLGINITTLEGFESEFNFRLNFLMLFLGASGAIFLYNLLLFLQLRSKVYFYYVSYSFTFILFAFSTTHFNLYLHEDPKTLHLFYPLATISYAFMVLFIRSLIQSRAYLGKVDLILQSFVGIFTVLTLLVAYSVEFYSLVVVISPVITVSLIATTLYAFYKKAPCANYISLVMGIYLTGILMLILTNEGMIEYNFFTRNAFIIGSVFEMIGFSMVLGSRMKASEVEKNLAQSKLINLQRDEQKRLKILVHEKTESLNKINRELELLSITDKLTQVKNRAGIDKALTHEVKRYSRYKHSFGVIILDIDYFKSVNDRFGHQVGDEVLMSIAKILKIHTRLVDVVGRWGGEEFLIITPESTLKESVDVANRLREAIENETHNIVEGITASFGVALFSEGDDKDSVLSRADSLLYQAKNLGRNRVEFGLDERKR